MCACLQLGFDDSEVDVDLVASLVEYICLHERAGAVLVFMPGMDEITRATSAIESMRLPQSVVVFPLHSSCTPQEQRAIFKSVPHGTRKVVIATNIAESSITIDDVVFVIDSGKHKEMAYVMLTHSLASTSRCNLLSHLSHRFKKAHSRSDGDALQ
jgi:HrpA-like RNA helicase